MALTIAVEAQAIIDRLDRIDREKPNLDQERAEAALAQHFRRLGIPPRPVRWLEDNKQGFLEAWSRADALVWSVSSWAVKAARLVAAAAAPHGESHAAYRSLGGRAAAAVRLEAEDAAWRALQPARHGIGSPPYRPADLPLSTVEWAWLAAALPVWPGLPKRISVKKGAHLWLPFVDALEAGLWRLWVLDREILAAPRPTMRVSGNRLHGETGPAVEWLGGRKCWFWRGVQVSQRVIEDPASLHVWEIQEVANVEVRRVMLERYGVERFLRDAGATKIQTDEFGTLWRVDFPRDDPLVMVEVINHTAEPDGSFKTYMLRVPPRMKSAKQAVAWTFGLREDEYSPKVQT
jgi:hypothetical protein